MKKIFLAENMIIYENKFNMIANSLSFEYGVGRIIVLQNLNTKTNVRSWTLDKVDVVYLAVTFDPLMLPKSN